MRLNPALHTRVWGGRKLETRFGKSLPTDQPYGESWELHDSSTVATGKFAGRSVGELLAEFGSALTGSDADPSQGFPLLIKILDSRDWLSVQVHPDDTLAFELEGEPRGKTEAWIVLDAEPDGRLCIGLQPDTTREQMADAIRENRLEPLLRIRPVQTGDTLYLRAGTVHALGPGVLVYEVQQSSDQTYRLYDWGRVGLDGQPRALHIDKGVRASRMDFTPQMGTIENTPVFDGPYFSTNRLVFADSPQSFDTGSTTFHAWTAIEGVLELTGAGETVPFKAGETVLVPASVGPYAVSGTGAALLSMP
jgi:mannose-6-phosphate isomerase